MIKTVNHPEEDLRLLHELSIGSISAFNTLYDKYWAYIYNLAYKRLQDISLAKDTTQDIFLKLWQQREHLKVENLQAYLYVCTRNQVIKLMEKENKYCSIPVLLDQFRTSGDKTDGRIREKEFMAAYKKLLRELTPSQQNIYRLRYLEDLSTDIIAKQLHISRKTVQNQLAYCRHKLKETLLLIILYCFLIAYK
ncbi:RNA polymerase sigma factor [Olivibacter domesticus]|uniref:RNA polymerase sigma-70 factor, ECF subfamily n=1 Tax=Olivibacter domesticus TaxID=407022 RepID=A0A1H7W101_OLID1|nr:sigma-70 family RNA polymerase sigma factor [Olivibacter domesticus]SEM15163.1 RNA polymerase sigma-70 factor, ECF subfamily [Olivibacter domesticus]